MKDYRYAGFWIRFAASFLDTFLLALPVGVVIYFVSDGQWFDWQAYQSNLQLAMHGDSRGALSSRPQPDMQWEIVFELSVLAVTALFWRQFKGATPGKKIVGITVVDHQSGGELSNKQAITRSLSYIVSTLVFLMGFLMVAFRQDKRGLHDLIAGTAVVYNTQPEDEE